VLHYTFESDGGGVVSDVSGHGYTGLVASATWTGGGLLGGAMGFDGVSNYVTSLNIESLVRSGQYSFSLWFAATDGRTTNPQYLYGSRNAGLPDNREYMRIFGLAERTAGQLEIGPITDGVQNNMFTGLYVANGYSGWQHAVLPGWSGVRCFATPA
jgi:hypothetical protein